MRRMDRLFPRLVHGPRGRSGGRFLARFLAAGLLMALPALAAEPIAPAEALEKALAAYSRLTDYTCVLERKERLDGSVKEQPRIRFRFKKPGSYSMSWKGDLVERAVYVEGRHENKMLVRGAGLFSFIVLAVDPAKALKYGRHVIAEADLGWILKIFETNYRKSLHDPEATIVFEGEEDLGGRKTWRFKAVLPPDRGYYGHRVTIHFDQALHLPVRIEVIGWQGELIEVYAYSDLRLDVGLSDRDFEIKGAED